MAAPSIKELRDDVRRRQPIAVEVTVEAGAWPPENQLAVLCRRAVDAAQAELGLRLPVTGSEVAITFTDDAHVRKLNAEWRGKDSATNVLSFPAFTPDRGGPVPPLLGDIVLADRTVALEAALAGKPLDHHITHLVAHGLLHLIGYDHETDEDGDEMEAMEARILARLAIPDPYA